MEQRLHIWGQFCTFHVCWCTSFWTHNDDEYCEITMVSQDTRSSILLSLLASSPRGVYDLWWFLMPEKNYTRCLKQRNSLFAFNNELEMNHGSACHHKCHTRLIYRPAWATNWDPNKEHFMEKKKWSKASNVERVFVGEGQMNDLQGMWIWLSEKYT